MVGSTHDFEVSGRVATDGELEAVLGAADADVVLLDLADWRGRGRDAIRTLARSRSTAPVVVLAEPSLRWSRTLLASGVRGVLPLDSQPEEVRAAIAAVVAGLVVLRPEHAVPVAAEPVVRDGQRGTPTRLTPRELEVLAHLVDGLSNRMIATQLEVSERTVKFHVASIFEKLGVRGRTEAITTALRRGLVLI